MNKIIIINNIYIKIFQIFNKKMIILNKLINKKKSIKIIYFQIINKMIYNLKYFKVGQINQNN